MWTPWLTLIPAFLAFGADLRVPSLVVVEKASGKVGFFDADGTLVKEVPVGVHPHEMVFSSNGRFLFVTDNGVMVMTDKAPGQNTIPIVDTLGESKSGVIDLGPHRRPHGIDFDPSTGHVLVTTELPGALLILDPVKRTVINTYDVRGRAPHMVRLAPDRHTAFVTCTDTNSLSIIDMKSGETVVLPTGPRPQGIVFSPDFRRLYVANSDGHTLTVVDAAAKKVIGDIAVGSGHSGPVRVAISPDGKTAVSALQLDHAVSFAGTATMKEEGTIPLPGSPVSMTLSADGVRAYCSVQDLDTVFEISIPNRRIIRSFRTPPHSGPDPVLPIPR